MSKNFHISQSPTPERDLLAEFWKLERKAEMMLEGLASAK